MTIGELKKLIEPMSDHEQMMICVGDHTYGVAKAGIASFVNEGHGSYCTDTDVYPDIEPVDGLLVELE